MQLFVGVGLMLLMVVLELLFVKYVMREEVPAAEIVSNLNSGHIVLWIFRGLEIAGYHLALQYISFDLVTAWPVWLQWTFAFLAWDFCFYWLHRIHHHLPSLWSVHVVHHEGEHFSLSLGIRNSWFSSLTSLPFFLPLALLGVPLEQFIICGSINYFIQFYNHNHVVRRSGWLEYVLITPSHHRVHHGHEDVYCNRNFGGTRVLWDKWFGTFQPELDARPPSFGVAGYAPSHNIVWMNAVPVLRWLGVRRLVRGALARRFTLSSERVLAAGLPLFGLLALYVYYEQSWGAAPLRWLFVYVFGATLALGGLLEGQRWGIWLWVGVTWGTVAILLATGTWREWWMLSGFAGWLALISFELFGLGEDGEAGVGRVEEV